jgi:hypothetical protein
MHIETAVINPASQIGTLAGGFVAPPAPGAGSRPDDGAAPGRRFRPLIDATPGDRRFC